MFGLDGQVAIITGGPKELRICVLCAGYSSLGVRDSGETKPKT